MTELKYERTYPSRTPYYVSEPQLRERNRTTRYQETPTQPSLPPNNNLKLADIYHRYYSQQAPIVKVGLVALAVILSYLLSHFILSSTPIPSPFFRKFSHETNHVFKDINSLDLPASSSVTQHTVACRNVASMVQNSPAFEKHGTQIASGLREFGERIITAGRNLQNMYNKGSKVYESFDIEIEAMMDRLKSDHKKGDAKYFKNALNKLTTRVQDYRKVVEKAQSSIQNAEEIRHDTEGYIHDGLREAEKFIGGRNNAQHVVDIANAKKEFESVSDILNHLSNAAVHLDRLRKILINYEDRLLDVEAELGDAGKEDDDHDIFEVTREDLKYLKLSINNLKSCHEKFQRLSA